MAPDLDYAIVVPSRRRAHNMPTIRRLLPTAIVSIDERELADYAPFVPMEKLLLHPPLEGSPQVRNWIMDAVTSEILIMIDDDFRRVFVLTGWRRSGRGGMIDDPEDILAILENAARAAKDVGAATFCFSRTANQTLLRPSERPIRPMPVLANVYGLMGPARHRKMDPRFAGRNDIDNTLRALLLDRFGYQDVRFYFDCGPIFGARGGNVGLITGERFAESTRALKEVWGKHVSFKRSEINWRVRIDTMKVVVPRSNRRAQR